MWKENSWKCLFQTCEALSSCCGTLCNKSQFEEHHGISTRRLRSGLALLKVAGIKLSKSPKRWLRSFHVYGEPVFAVFGDIWKSKRLSASANSAKVHRIGWHSNRQP